MNAQLRFINGNWTVDGHRVEKVLVGPRVMLTVPRDRHRLAPGMVVVPVESTRSMYLSPHLFVVDAAEKPAPIGSSYGPFRVTYLTGAHAGQCGWWHFDVFPAEIRESLMIISPLTR